MTSIAKSRYMNAIAGLTLATSILAGLAWPVAAQGTPEQESGEQEYPGETLIEALEWRSIGPANMSGRVTDVEGIPGTPVFYIATATGGIWKTTNHGITFRSLFTEERVVSMGDIAISPSDTSIVWAGTGEEDSRNSISPGGGVYKSEDGGITWELMGLEETQAVGRIVVHPTDPDLVYVAALGHIWNANEERGLYRTQDGGETWERILHVSDKAGFVDIAMHPNDPAVLFASSWERVRGPWFLQSGGPGSGIWRSEDGGDSWTRLGGGGLPETEMGRVGLAIAHSDPSIMYALIEAADPEEPEEPEEDDPEEDDAEEDDSDNPETEEDQSGDGQRGSGLYRSEDGGSTWRWMNGSNTRPFYYSQVRVDPSDPDFVIWSSTPVRLSKDGGQTIGQTTLGLHVDHHALWWDVTNPNYMVVGNDGGIGITWDKGGNWDFPNPMALGQFYAVSYNMDIPYRVCGGLQDNGTWCGPSRRRSGGITNAMWATVNGGDGFYAPQDKVDPDLMWAESQGGNMVRLNTNSGSRRALAKPNWSEGTRALRDELALVDPADSARANELAARISADSAAMVLRWNWNTPMVVSSHDREVFYAGANRVLKSTARGDDLVPISPDLSYADSQKIRISTGTTGGITRDVTGAETYATITALAESPRNAGWLFAGTDDGRVWMTRDDAGSWTELTGRFPGAPEGTYVSRIEPSHHTDSRFYVTFDGHRSGDFAPYLYVTNDGGDTFVRLKEGLPTGGPDFIHVVREDPVNENLLFVGTDVGVYVSLDRGAFWHRFMNGLPTVPVHDLKVHPRDRELIAGTHGRSVWIVDIAPLAHVAGRDMDSDIWFAEPRVALQFGDPFVGGESTGHRFYRGVPSPYGAEFMFYVSRETVSTLRDEARARRDSIQAAAEAAGEEAPPNRPFQAEIAVMTLEGDTVQHLSSSLSGGLRRVYWDYSVRVETPPLSPAERRDSLRIVEGIQAVADSFVAEGEEPDAVERIAEQLRNTIGRRTPSGPIGGGSGAMTTMEFRERPGESYTERSRSRTRRRPDRANRPPSLNRRFSDELRERGLIGTALFTRRRSGSEIAEPGRYRVVLRIGALEFESELEIVRKPGYVPNP